MNSPESNSGDQMFNEQELKNTIRIIKRDSNNWRIIHPSGQWKEGTIESILAWARIWTQNQFESLTFLKEHKNK